MTRASQQMEPRTHNAMAEHLAALRRMIATGEHKSDALAMLDKIDAICAVRVADVPRKYMPDRATLVDVLERLQVVSTECFGLRADLRDANATIADLRLSVEARDLTIRSRNALRAGVHALLVKREWDGDLFQPDDILLLSLQQWDDAQAGTIADLRAECRPLKSGETRLFGDGVPWRPRDPVEPVAAADEPEPHKHSISRWATRGDIAYRWCECGARQEKDPQRCVWSDWIDALKPPPAPPPTLEAQLADAMDILRVAVADCATARFPAYAKVSKALAEVERLEVAITARDGKVSP